MNVGLEFGDEPEVTPENTVADFSLDGMKLQQFADEFTYWDRLARNVLDLDLAKAAARVESQRRWKPARINDAFLKRIAEEYVDRTQRGQNAVSEIARAHGVQVPAASKWVSRARDRGFISREGGEQNG